MARFDAQWKRTVQGLLLAAIGFGSGLAVAEEPANSCQDRPYCLGTVSGHAAFAAWDIDILPDGSGLPDGQGDAKRGEEIYAEQCAVCHGEDGTGGVKEDPEHGGYPALVSGDSVVPLTSLDKWPSKNIGTYWPYATTVFDYVRRSMPFAAPQSLSNDEVYSVVAYLLARNKLIPEDMVVNKSNLAAVEMPNQEGFACDSRPDIFNERCMSDCAVPGDPAFDASQATEIDGSQADCMVVQ